MIQRNADTTLAVLAALLTTLPAATLTYDRASSTYELRYGDAGQSCFTARSLTELAERGR